ncbi:MAG: hypothetical protein QNJ68_03560 [Microcoleaceae cyanobacterium MO_207.B10]|nr:hypothetical protein [Microcoleaceae cyanobacterium MO_207.B10]
MVENLSNWQKQVIDKIEEEEKKLALGPVNPDLEWHQQPDYKVFSYTPNRDLDQDIRYYLAGPDWSVLQQSSLLKATHDMLAQRLGYGIDFEKWFEDFEYEFQRNLPSTKQIAGSKLKPWGREVANRPKKLNLLTKKQAADLGYMKIRFWKDRSVENDSEVLAGTYLELREQLLERMRVVDANVEVYGIPTTTYQQIFKFAPQVLLYFLEDPEDIDPAFNAVDGRVSFRVMGETYKTIKPAKAQSLAEKIATIFGANNGLIWKKGKTVCRYYDSDNGYQFRISCRDKNEGKALITNVLALQNHNPHWSKLKTSNNEEPEQAYPIIPPKENVYDTNHYLPRKFPIADVRFQRAELHIWSRRKPVILVDRSYKSKDALIRLP